MSPQYYSALFARVFSTASALFAGILSMWLYKSYFTPKTYGMVLMAVQIMGYLSLLDGGFRTTVNRSLLAGGSPEERQRIIRFSQRFYSYLALIIFAGAMMLMSVYYFSRNAQTPLFFFMAMGVAGAFVLIGNIQMQLLIGLGAQTKCFFLNGANAWLTVLSMALALHARLGVWAFPISTLTGFIGVYPAVYIILRRMQPGFKLFDFERGPEFWNYFHRLKRDAWNCFRSQVSIMFLFTVDVVIIGYCCGDEEVATYGTLARVFTIVRNFLQTMAEVGWPFIAQKTHDHSRFMSFLPRLNAWVYGSVMGALCVSLGPFLTWFMGPEWTPANLVIWLLAIRFLIIGASSPACYFLIGLGEFKAIARLIERELAVAVVGGILLGVCFGMTGVVVGFLVSTTVGTFLPLFWEYARAAERSVGTVIWEAWWRALAGFAASSLAAFNLVAFLGEGGVILPIGVVAACVPLAAVLLIFLHGKWNRRDLLDLI